MLKEGYTLPFQTRPGSTRSPNIISCYVNPHRNLYLLQALHQLMDKNAVKLVQYLKKKKNGDTGNHQNLPPTRGVGYLNRLQGCLLPHTSTGTVQKYLRFHVEGRTYQFKALPFGLSTAPMEFTVVAKEVKPMAIHRGIRIHQHLDDWLLRARSHQVCLQHTQDLVKICHQLGWLVNLEKSELEPKQVFDFVGYQFDLKSGRVQPTLDCWQNLRDKIHKLLSRPACPAGNSYP